MYLEFQTAFQNTGTCVVSMSFSANMSKDPGGGKGKEITAY